MNDNTDVIIYNSVLKPSGVRLLVFIMLFSIFPILLILMSDIPDNIKTLFTTLYVLTAYTYFTVQIYDRVRQSAVVVVIASDRLTVIKFGKIFSIPWDAIVSVEIRERVTGRYAEIGGIQLETNIKSGKFMKTTVDFFIPDLFDISKKTIEKQIKIRKDHCEVNTNRH